MKTSKPTPADTDKVEFVDCQFEEKPKTNIVVCHEGDSSGSSNGVKFEFHISKFTDSAVKIRKQPGFKKWSYYHKMRKYARMVDNQNSSYWRKTPQQIQCLDYGSAPRILKDHYRDLCWDKDSTEYAAKDSQRDLAVYRNNRKYVAWVKKNYRFKVGEIVQFSSEAQWLISDHGYGPFIIDKVIEVSNVDNGLPMIIVRRQSDNKLVTDGDRLPVTFGAGWFVEDHPTLHWKHTAQQERDELADM